MIEFKEFILLWLARIVFYGALLAGTVFLAYAMWTLPITRWLIGVLVFFWAANYLSVHERRNK